jgi:hypothetical protein
MIINMIQLDPASLTIGYVCGTLLCWYLRDMLDAKESEYEREAKESDKDNDSSDGFGSYVDAYRVATGRKR